MAFDTLELVNALEGSGVSREHAEAHAKALKEHVMPELATKSDIVEIKNLISLESQRLIIAMGSMVTIGVGLIITVQKLF